MTATPQCLMEPWRRYKAAGEETTVMLSGGFRGLMGVSLSAPGLTGGVQQGFRGMADENAGIGMIAPV